MKKEIILNFKNILNELEEKELKICFLKGNGSNILIKDTNDNLYDIEPYFHNSYLDELIKDGVIIRFNLIDDKEAIKNINRFGNMEVWQISKVEEFIKRQSQYW